MNSSIFRKTTAAALCAAVLLTMTACNNNTSSVPESVPAPSSSSDAAVSDTSSEAPASTAETESSSAENSSAQEEVSIPEDTPYTLGGELTPAMVARSRYNEGNKARLVKAIKKLQANEETTVVFLGGSITHGTSAGDDLCYAKLTADKLQAEFPEAKLNYINAGIGATDSLYGLARADDDVLSKNPDIVFVDFSVNDTTEFTDIYKESYAALLKKIWSSPSAPAIVALVMTEDNGTSMQEVHGEIAKAFDIPMVSYHDAVLSVIDNGSIAWTDISDDNIHPNVEGHALLSDIVMNYLQSVIDDADNISDEEYDFSDNSEYGTKYKNDTLFMLTTNSEPKNLGGFEKAENNRTRFAPPWQIRSTDGQFADTDAIEFEFDGTGVSVMFVTQGKHGAKADVYVDGELVKTVDSAITDGRSTSVSVEEISSGLAAGTHTIKIAPVSAEESVNFYLSGLAIER